MVVPLEVLLFTLILVRQKKESKEISLSSCIAFLMPAQAVQELVMEVMLADELLKEFSQEMDKRSQTYMI